MLSLFRQTERQTNNIECAQDRQAKLNTRKEKITTKTWRLKKFLYVGGKFGAKLSPKQYKTLNITVQNLYYFMLQRNF